MLIKIKGLSPFRHKPEQGKALKVDSNKLAIAQRLTQVPDNVTTQQKADRSELEPFPYSDISAVGLQQLKHSTSTARCCGACSDGNP